ncbi:hypothetical protein I0C86_36425 [Plantactinospora sp. S1510]|uniref:Uncharacterized protein n=1 Tax=Plantactinospora alkalitolerans TaxID=2789879 RepID=A0ABS0H7D1_9ACTN|nr:hypothetical protein [Plantactinospora alkalitolerans]MBF9134376.1 hypothetical protein [Plantactinospora alkalitolerans]
MYQPMPTGGPDRVRVPDARRMRQGAWRVARAAVIVIVLLMFFSAGGIAMLVAGEAPALPFAVGGVVAQLSVVALVVGVLRVRVTLVGDTVARTALVAARRLFATVRVVLLVTVALLVGYAVVRLVTGDPWTLLTTGIVGSVLWLLALGLGRLRDGLVDSGTVPPASH